MKRISEESRLDGVPSDKREGDNDSSHSTADIAKGMP